MWLHMSHSYINLPRHERFMIVIDCFKSTSMPTVLDIKYNNLSCIVIENLFSTKNRNLKLGILKANWSYSHYISSTKDEECYFMSLLIKQRWIMITPLVLLEKQYLDSPNIRLYVFDRMSLWTIHSTCLLDGIAYKLPNLLQKIERYNHMYNQRVQHIAG